MKIGKLLEDIFDDENYSILKRYKSKKNEVYLIRLQLEDLEIKVVLKKYSHISGKEVEILQSLKRHNLNIPSIHLMNNKYIIMEYLPGPTLLEYLCRQEEMDADIDKLKPVICKFIGWLDEFYSIFRHRGLIFGDINFSNFILLDNTEIYGFDFEDCSIGPVELDIGRICAFCITYIPAFTPWKQELTGELLELAINILDLDVELTFEKYRSELTAIQVRRNLDIPGYIYNLL